MDKKHKTLKIIKVAAIGLFMGFFVWVLCVGVGTLFDFGESNSKYSNFTNMNFIGVIAGIVTAGTFTYLNVKWALKK